DLGSNACVADRHGGARGRLAAHERERDRAEGRGDADRAGAPEVTVGAADHGAALDGLGQPQPAQVAVRLALVEKPRDGLLAHVAALREADRALVYAGLLPNHIVPELEPEPLAPGLDAEDLSRLGSHLGELRALAEDVDAVVGRDVEPELALAV